MQRIARGGKGCLFNKIFGRNVTRISGIFRERGILLIISDSSLNT